MTNWEAYRIEIVIIQSNLGWRWLVRAGDEVIRQGGYFADPYEAFKTAFDARAQWLLENKE